MNRVFGGERFVRGERDTVCESIEDMRFDLMVRQDMIDPALTVGEDLPYRG